MANTSDNSCVAHTNTHTDTLIWLAGNKFQVISRGPVWRSTNSVNGDSLLHHEKTMASKLQKLQKALFTYMRLERQPETLFRLNFKLF